MNLPDKISMALDELGSDIRGLSDAIDVSNSSEQVKDILSEFKEISVKFCEQYIETSSWYFACSNAKSVDGECGG